MNIFRWLLDQIKENKDSPSPALVSEVMSTSPAAMNPIRLVSPAPSFVEESISKLKSSMIPARVKNLSFNVIEIPEINFFGSSNLSRSGEWLVAWSDGNVGNCKNRGHYALYNNSSKHVVLQGAAQRPNKCSVSDSGIFYVEDWQSPLGLSGSFYVLSPAGEQLISRKFEANILNSGISHNGLYAICQTANSKIGNDGNKLTAFDLVKRCEIFSITPKTDLATEYNFYEDIGEIGVVIKEVGEFRYNLNGEFIDSEKYAQARLSNEKFTDIILQVEVELKRGINKEHAKAILDSIEKAMELGADRYPTWKSMALKLQGNTYLIAGDEKLALKSFDEALKLDPNIGIKRKADALRKKLL